VVLNGNGSMSRSTTLYKRHRQGFRDTFYMNEVFVKIDGTQHDLWRAVDQDGEIVDVFLQR